MSDVSQVITLGIGTPADIPHFVLVGLSTNPNPTPPHVVIYNLAAALLTQTDRPAGITQTANAGASLLTQTDRAAGVTTTMNASVSLVSTVNIRVEFEDDSG